MVTNMGREIDRLDVKTPKKTHLEIVPFPKPDYKNGIEVSEFDPNVAQNNFSFGG
jgi:hypothetical protein